LPAGGGLRRLPEAEPAGVRADHTLPSRPSPLANAAPAGAGSAASAPAPPDCARVRLRTRRASRPRTVRGCDRGRCRCLRPWSGWGGGGSDGDEGLPTSMVAPSSPWSSATTPAYGDGTSTSDLAVSTSTSGAFDLHDVATATNQRTTSASSAFTEIGQQEGLRRHESSTADRPPRRECDPLPANWCRSSFGGGYDVEPRHPPIGAASEWKQRSVTRQRSPTNRSRTRSPPQQPQPFQYYEPPRTLSRRRTARSTVDPRPAADDLPRQRLSCFQRDRHTRSIRDQSRVGASTSYDGGPDPGLRHTQINFFLGPVRASSAPGRSPVGKFNCPTQQGVSVRTVAGATT